MKTILFLSIAVCIFLSPGLANGVAVVDASKPTYLHLDSTSVIVSVVGQISKTISTQYFTNRDSTATVKYAFPLSEQASAIQLRWKVGTQWYEASVAGTPQDTTLPGAGTASTALMTYLGKTPLYFSIPQSIGADSALTIELTYVEFLPYSFGNVTYAYPSDYHLIQESVIAMQRFDFGLTSQRLIDSISVTSHHTILAQSNDGMSARVQIELREQPGTEDYALKYSLNLNQLGLFAYSSMLPGSSVPDSLGNGFLTFIAEPDPDPSTSTISKVFTLIIDRSGSMTGTKIEQAKDAAAFIVQNLNEGDRFNLIDFDDVISCFRPTHVPFTPQSRDSALLYVANLTARNNTSISGAFGTAVPQFAAANDSTANIIIFLTDGLPTVDITDIPQLIQYVDNLIITSERRISVFCFGIGGDVNQQLLTILSSHNNGLAEFLGNDELYSRITSFYLTIRNPVLLNSHISFSPSVVTEVFPDSLPNLYKGKQMIVAGRYDIAQPVQISLTGTAFGKAVRYDYVVALSDSSILDYQFLPKVWAKRKIESLLVRYYSLPSGSEPADSVKSQIVTLSRAYGVITEFTSFSGGGGGGSVADVNSETFDTGLHPKDFEVLGNYPNPFNPSTTIRLKMNVNHTGPISIRIYNILGQVVRTLHLQIQGQGLYHVAWDGRDDRGLSLPSGIYLYAIEFRGRIVVGKMNLVK